MNKQGASEKTGGRTGASRPKKTARKAAPVMDDREKLLEDLRLHQAELEAQNEELRAAQHALEASRSKYADLFELAPVGYFTLDEHGMIWDVNLIGAAQLGQARSALDRKPFRIFVDPKYRDAFRVHHAHVFTTGKRATCELEFIRRDRTKFFGRLDSVPLDERDGYKKCFTAVTNVTNQKQAEESLRESEEKFRLIAELSSDVIFQLNAAGKITYASPAVNRYGFKPEKLIGTAFTAYVHPQDLTRAEHTLQQVASGRRIDMLELQLRYANGSYYYADINVTPVKRQGSIAGIQGIMRDITERKRYERAILRSLGRFELLSGTADTLLLSTDPQTVVETVCTKVLEHLDCQVYFNFLVDERAGKLHLNAFAGIPPDEAVKIEWLDFGHAVCGCAARDRQRIVAECISTTPDDRTSLVRSYGV
ncbi:MAG TPA: PAS domain-containing protein, partial [Nitrospirota bacterium]|nr:PAS domain-containing protein [Nitrospirota bacterium]